jgi:hypothetical protein
MNQGARKGQFLLRAAAKSGSELISKPFEIGKHVEKVPPPTICLSVLPTDVGIEDKVFLTVRSG